MKRYMVFYGGNYYPEGGMKDFVGDFPTLKGANNALERKRRKDKEDWGGYDAFGHVYDTEERRIVLDKQKGDEQEV